MNLRIKPLIVLIILLFGQTLAAAQSKSILKLADEYSRALKKYQRQKARVSVEGVFRKGQMLGDKWSEVEALSEADYALFKKKMKGFDINREEIVYIEPDSKFFAQLARTRGVKSDVAFFALMRQIKPDNVWAAYIEQQTDVTGCTRYGGGLLTRLYGKALQFKRTYPKAYKAEINEEIDEIVSSFRDNICACGDRAGVLREFRLFVKTFPRDKLTPKIKNYIKTFETQKEFRFYCSSG